MNTIVKMKMSTNPRLLKDVLTMYKSTFFALKELIDNSIQATAKKIDINLTPSSCQEDTLDYKKIEKIEINDNGDGVPFSMFERSIMRIATENKAEGQGVGRFGALQIGKRVKIETAAYDKNKKKYTRTSVEMTADNIVSSENLEELEFPIETEETDTPCDHYYKVIITDLYHYSSEKIKKKNKLSEEFGDISIFKQALFETYPFDIFEGRVRFRVNEEELKREHFLLDTPHFVTKEFECSDGKKCEIRLTFYRVNLKTADISIYFQVENGGIKQSIAKYSYVSPWHTPDLGTWFILVESDLITTDMMVDFAFADFGNNAKDIQQLIKDTIDDFFKKDNRKFVSFVDRLKADKNYPYQQLSDKPSLEESLFNHTAYILELDQKFLDSASPSRAIIYPMVKKLIEEGNVEFLYGEILKLSKESRKKFEELLKLTDMDDVVEFSSSVSIRTSFLNFLYDLCYGDVSKWLKERSQLHKIIEKQLWIFGEEYTENTKLWSDKGIEHNLEELHKKHFGYKPTVEDENIIKECQGQDRDITDLFFYNQKKLGYGREEVFVVELKAPSCAISNKEMTQIESYRDDILDSSAYPKNKVSYKLLLISSRITKSVRRRLEGTATWNNPDDRFLYSVSNEEGAEIKIYVMEWSELIKENRKKLTYLSESLPIKPEDVGEKFAREYPHLLDEKSRNRLNQRKLE